ncbi:hypothetical protein SADUNF_Sadunf01G0175000 [Salix dunnii]|uniref:Protein kinase domain-containing protein n=1 Tax=Salix dunnii TaxID=1413687 RepID=A0A835TL16_9ROSI|nr:hypothetical protein SADUNF_Sadunf01G0175000 [Salix dunnii]
MTKNALITHTLPASRVLAYCALSDSGDMNHAHLLFSQLQNPSTYIWNTMIRGCSRAQTGQNGFLFFCQMVQKGVEMDCRSFVFAFKPCEQFLGVLEGKSVHCAVWKMGFVFTLLVQNGLVHFYGMRGCLGLALQVFDEISERDVVSWTSMIDGYSKHKLFDEAVKLFDSMLMFSNVKPNERDLRLGKTFHEHVKTRNVTRSLNLTNVILDMYVKCGCLDTAREIFDTMGVRDVFSWTSMVNGYAKNGELEMGRALFNEMPERNVSQNNLPKEALELFHSMLEAAAFVPMENTLRLAVERPKSTLGTPAYIDPEVLSRREYDGKLAGVWSCGVTLSVMLVGAYPFEDPKNFRKTINVLQSLVCLISSIQIILLELWQFNTRSATMSTYLRIHCRHLLSRIFVANPTRIFDTMGVRDVFSWTSMVNGYAKNGELEVARALFNEIPERNVVSWNAMIAGYSQNNQPKEALELFQRMLEAAAFVPMENTLVCVLSACGQLGCLD